MAWRMFHIFMLIPHILLEVSDNGGDIRGQKHTHPENITHTLQVKCILTSKPIIWLMLFAYTDEMDFCVESLFFVEMTAIVYLRIVGDQFH